MVLPAGQGDFTGTVTLRSGVTIEGQGTTTTKIIVKNDLPAFTIAGASNGDRIHRVRLRGLTIDAENSSTNTTGPLVFAQYGDTCLFDNVNFVNKIGVGFECQDFWDSVFFNCRWDHCGGTDGASPSFLAYNSASGNTNNLAFYNCIWETFRDGGIWFVGEQGGSSLVPEVFHFFNCKWDCVGSALGPYLLGSQVTQIRLLGGSCNFGADSEADTFEGFVFRKTARDVSIRDFQFLFGGSQTNVTAAIHFDGTASTNVGIVLDNISGSTNSTSGPSTALIRFTGTNESVQIGPVYWRRNGGTYALFSGTPTKITPGMRLSSKAGALSDSDFASSTPGTLGGGAQLVGVDTTNHRLYLRYADGTYKYAALT